MLKASWSTVNSRAKARNRLQGLDDDGLNAYMPKNNEDVTPVYEINDQQGYIDV